MHSGANQTCTQHKHCQVVLLGTSGRYRTAVLGRSAKLWMDLRSLELTVLILGLGIRMAELQA